MNRQRSMDVATMLAAIVVLIVGLMAVAFERGCGVDPVVAGVTQESLVLLEG